MLYVTSTRLKSEVLQGSLKCGYIFLIHVYLPCYLGLAFTVVCLATSIIQQFILFSN